MNSKGAALDALDEMYDIFKEHGVKVVFHAGDIEDGYGVYKGQTFDVINHTMDARLKYFMKKYPKKKGIKTRFISGNHELKEFSSHGSNVCDNIAACKREDLIYDGELYARYKFNRFISMDIVHPKQAKAYALSYPAQSYLRNLSSVSLPDFIAFGHRHRMMSPTRMQGVWAMDTGGFKYPGRYEMEQGLGDDIGGFIIELKVDERERYIKGVKSQAYSFKRYRDYAKREAMERFQEV